MTDFNALIGALAAVEADMLINGPDGGRSEAYEQAAANLWWARIAERFGLPFGDPRPSRLPGPVCGVAVWPCPPRRALDGNPHAIDGNTGP